MLSDSKRAAARDSMWAWATAHLGVRRQGGMMNRVPGNYWPKSPQGKALLILFLIAPFALIGTFIDKDNWYTAAIPLVSITAGWAGSSCNSMTISCRERRRRSGCPAARRKRTNPDVPAILRALPPHRSTELGPGHSARIDGTESLVAGVWS